MVVILSVAGVKEDLTPFPHGAGSYAGAGYKSWQPRASAAGAS